MWFGRYRELFRTPSVGWLLATSLLGRLPNGMEGLALLLVTRHGSYAAAGATTGTYLVATCVSVPYVSRAADRFGRRAVLRITATAHAAAMLGLSLAAAHRPVLLGCALVAGATTPPLAASVRAAWPVLVAAGQRQVIFALEATLQELLFIAGPALVALLAAAGGAPVAVAACGLITLGGTVAFAADPAAERGRRELSASPSPAVLRTPGLAPVLAAAVALVGGLSIVEIGVVAFISGRQASAGAGVALALWSFGSLVGGVVYGAHPAIRVSLPVLLALTAASAASLAAAPGPVVLTGLLIAGGPAVAPTLARLYDRVGTASAGGNATEAFGWLTSGMLAGAAGGAALGGILVNAYGPRLAFLLAAAVVLTGAAVVRSAGRRRAAEPGASVKGSVVWDRHA